MHHAIDHHKRNGVIQDETTDRARVRIAQNLGELRKGKPAA
jgi:hypothetical protein